MPTPKIKLYPNRQNVDHTLPQQTEGAYCPTENINKI